MHAGHIPYIPSALYVETHTSLCSLFSIFSSLPTPLPVSPQSRGIDFLPSASRGPCCLRCWLARIVSLSSCHHLVLADTTSAQHLLHFSHSVPCFLSGLYRPLVAPAQTEIDPAQLRLTSRRGEKKKKKKKGRLLNSSGRIKRYSDGGRLEHTYTTSLVRSIDKVNHRKVAIATVVTAALPAVCVSKSNSPFIPISLYRYLLLVSLCTIIVRPSTWTWHATYDAQNHSL